MKALLSQVDRALTAGGTRLQAPLLLALRLLVGISLAVYGAAKLGDLSQTTSNFASLGIPLPGLNAVLAGLAECVGGLLLALGGASRWAAGVVAFVMTVAYLSAHAGESLVASKPFPYLVVALIVFAFGPGAWSLDERLRPRPKTEP